MQPNSRKTAYSKLTLVFLLFSIAGSQGCKGRSSEEVEEIIAKSAILQQIDVVCKEFPKPTSFELEKKDLYGNSEISAISYRYIAHMPFDSVKAFYQNQELRNAYGFQNETYLDNWANEINFRRGDVRINVENRPPSWIINIGCSSTAKLRVNQKYPALWFAPINDPNKPDWEILPQEAKPGEVSYRRGTSLCAGFCITASRSLLLLDRTAWLDSA